MTPLERARCELRWEENKLEFFIHDCFNLQRRKTYLSPYHAEVNKIGVRIHRLKKLIQELEVVSLSRETNLQA